MAGDYDMSSNYSEAYKDHYQYCHKKYPDALDYCAHVRILDIVWLLLSTSTGCLSNLLLISSILFYENLEHSGHIFVINLAVLESVVTFISLPIVLANQFNDQQNVLPDTMCKAIGFVTLFSEVSAICGITLLAINRFWIITYPESYPRYFSKRGMWIQVFGVWAYSLAVVSPTLLADASDLIYVPGLQACHWNHHSFPYNIVNVTLTIYFPVVVMLVCYVSVFHTIRSRLIRIVSTGNRRRSRTTELLTNICIEKELSLVKTMAVTSGAFIVTWTPIAVVVTVDAAGYLVPYAVTKLSHRLSMSISCLNSVIYALVSSDYRNRYKKFMLYMFCPSRHPRVNSDAKNSYVMMRNRITRRGTVALMRHTKFASAFSGPDGPGRSSLREQLSEHSQAQQRIAPSPTLSRSQFQTDVWEMPSFQCSRSASGSRLDEFKSAKARASALLHYPLVTSQSWESQPRSKSSADGCHVRSAKSSDLHVRFSLDQPATTDAENSHGRKSILSQARSESRTSVASRIRFSHTDELQEFLDPSLSAKLLLKASLSGADVQTNDSPVEPNAGADIYKWEDSVGKRTKSSVSNLHVSSNVDLSGGVPAKSSPSWS